MRGALVVVACISVSYRYTGGDASSDDKARGQVEAEWGDLTASSQPSDALLMDLEARKVELQVRIPSTSHRRVPLRH